MSDDDRKKREAIYTETRKDLLTRQLSNSEKFDGAILTLSTAALGVSLTFVKDIAPITQEIQDICLLKNSWWLFGFAILSTVVSFLVSQLGINTQLKYAEEYYLNQKEEYLNKVNNSAKITEILNYLAAFFFIAALIFTIMFVSGNLREDFVMAEDKGNKAVPLREGAPIPSMQPAGGEADKKGAPIPNMQPVPSNTNNQQGKK